MSDEAKVDFTVLDLAFERANGRQLQYPNEKDETWGPREINDALDLLRDAYPALKARLEAAEAENAELRTQADAWKKVAYSGDSVKTKMRREFDEEIDSLNLRLSEQSKALHDIRAKNTMLEKENAELRAKVAELEAETARLRDMAAVAFCAGRDA